MVPSLHASIARRASFTDGYGECISGGWFERAHDVDVHRHVRRQARGAHFRREAHAAEDLHGARVAALHLRQELRLGLALDQRAAHAAPAELDGEHQPHRSRADDQDFGIDRLIIISA